MSRESAASEIEKRFQLLPLPDTGGFCPRCDGGLSIRSVRIGGWRMLLEGRCAVCGHDYLQDLPAGHGLVYPTTLDLHTGETIDAASATWFSDPLRALWEHPDQEPVRFRVAKRSSRNQGVLLNCLDPVYGHSVLKLLNAQRHVDEGLVLLIPGALESIVPDGVAEIWVVDEPPRRFRAWLSELERAIEEELERFAHCVLSPAFPHPHPSSYRIADFAPGIEPAPAGIPTVVLSLRDDRRWGRTERAQTRNIQALIARLRRRFPDLAVAAVGVGGQTRLSSGVDDRRSASPTIEEERAWLALLRGADLVIGVHGSNMLLPSGLAAATLELQPRYRIDHVFQATILAERDPLEALANHRVLYGNDKLSDVSPQRVADVAVSLLNGRERFTALMLGPASGRTEAAVPHIRSSSAAPPYVARLVRQSLVKARRGLFAAHYLRRRAQSRVYEARAGRYEVPAILTDNRGLRFELTRREEIADFLLHSGHFERCELDFVAAYLRSGDVGLDVGANIGAFAAAMGRAVAPAGRIHAFEPHAESFIRLERTLALNAIDTVVVNRLAVGAAVGETDLALYGPGFESWATTVPRKIAYSSGTIVPSETVRVTATSLDDYCAAEGIHHVDVLKIDVEGGEPSVLEGAERLLDQEAIDVVLVEVSDNTLPEGWTSHELVELLGRSGLHPHVLDRGTLTAFRPAGPVEFANVVAVAGRALDRAHEAALQSRTKT
jgi:FkbM family methyltransferase